MLTYKGICIISVVNPIYSAHLTKVNQGNVTPHTDSLVQPWYNGDEELEALLSYSYHHTFSDYINAIIHNGLTILEMQEPLPTETDKTNGSGLEIPSYLIIKLQKN